MELMTSVFATSNNVEKIIEPLQSRFFVVKIQAYTYSQFYYITVRLLTSNQYNVDEKIAEAIINAAWSSSRNIRHAIKIARMAKFVEDVY
jgi:DNA polymerase III delta prime subunit